MEPVHYLRILWRRWPVLVICVGIAVVPAWLAEPAPAGRPVRTFVATHTLIRDTNAAAEATMQRLATAALLTTTGEVPRLVAQQVGFRGDPALLATQVTATPNDEVGSLAIRATNPDGARAAQLANAFAEQLVAHLASMAEQTRQRAVDQTVQALEDLQRAIRELDAVIAAGGRPGEASDLTRAQRDAHVREYGVAYQRLQQLASTQPGISGSGFVTLQRATPVPIVEGGFSPPSSRPGRVAAAIAIGLVVGSGIALLREHSNPRIRTKAAAEEAFELPVIVEVPRARRHLRHHLAVVHASRSHIADAYRIVRTSLRYPPARSSLADQAAPARADLEVVRRAGKRLTVLVTSAGAAEGKTTTVANLAAALAEAGRTVVAVDADLRHPRLHEVFGVERAAGLVDVLRSDADVGSAVRETGVAGVSVLTAGTPVENPARLLSRGEAWLGRVRLLADVVLIDAGPVLESSAASDLLPHADLVVLTSRIGHTRPASAANASEFLARMGAPVLGLVLIGSPAPAGPARGRLSPSRRQNGRWAGRNGRPGDAVDRRAVALDGDGSARAPEAPAAPGTPSAGWARHHELLHMVAAHGLPGGGVGRPSSPPHHGPLAADDWSPLLIAARDQRLTGLLLAAIDDGALAATDEQRREASDAHVEAMCLALELERTLLDVADTLGTRGIDLRVLKGPAVARLDYPDPSLRSFGDIDVLVRSEQWDAAVEALTEAGHERLYPEPRPGFDRRFSKGTTLRTAKGLEIDLHRTFVLGPFGLTVDLRHVWERSSPIELGGRRLEALDAEVRFLNACAHAALGDVPPRLVPLRDIAQMHMLGAELDVGRVIHLAGRWRHEAVVARALRLSWDTLGLEHVTPLTAWARGVRPDRRQQRALALYLDRRETYVALLLGTVRVVPGIRGKLGYLGALARPDDDFVSSRYASRLRRWRHAAAVGRRLRRPSEAPR